MSGLPPFLKFITAVLMVALVEILVLGPGCQRSRPTDVIVARVGKQAITLEDFLVDYTFFPKFRPNVSLRQARLQHLDRMIEEILLFKAAEKAHLDTIPEVRDHLQYALEREILNYLYKREILDRIQVSDSMAWEEYKKSKLAVHVRHLFAPDRATAWQLYHRLQKGERFEDLAREVFRDTLLSRNGGDLGFVPLTSLDPWLVDSVYHMRIGHISRPLQSSFGYHILQVLDVRREIFLDRQEFQRQKKFYVRMLKTRLALQKSAQYVREELKGKTVRIKRQALRQLMQLARQTLGPFSPPPQLNAPRLTNRELDQLMENGKAILKLPLLIFDGQQWSVADVLEHIRRRPPVQRLSFNNPEGVVQYLINMARDQLLLQKALQKGYRNAPEVQEAYARWRQTILANEFRKRIYMVKYQQQNPALWRSRRLLFQSLKTSIPVHVDTLALFSDVPAEKLKEKQIPIHTIIQESYRW